MPDIGSGVGVRGVIKESGFMKESIHPKYDIVKVTCSCGHIFETRSTLCSEHSMGF